MYINTNKKHAVLCLYLAKVGKQFITHYMYDAVEHLYQYKSKDTSLRMFKTNRDNQNATKT